MSSKTSKHTLNSKIEDKNQTFSLVTKDQILEQIYDAERNEISFIVGSENGKVLKKTKKITIDSVEYEPIKSTLVQKKAVLLPSGTKEYGSTKELIEDIRSFIAKYCEYPESFQKLDAYFVLHTWNYDKFSITPYRRVIGDLGSGKSRFLKVLGSICYRSVSLLSASSEAVLYRLIDKVHGTVTIDEADFNYSGLFASIIKILNSGYQKGTPVFKCDINTFEPECFDTFSPKIIASRLPFKDQALESRCITHETQICTRTDIPSILPLEFYREAESLRNKLLLYRFRNRLQPTEINKEVNMWGIEPRLKEVIIPLASLIKEKEELAILQKIVTQYQQSIIRKRNLGLGKIILESIIVKHYQNEPLSIGGIAEHVRSRLHLEDHELTARKVGSIIKKHLRLTKERIKVGNSVPIVVIWDQQKILSLCSKYGIDFNNLTSLISSDQSNEYYGIIGAEDINAFVPLEESNQKTDSENNKNMSGDSA